MQIVHSTRIYTDMFLTSLHCIHPQCSFTDQLYIHFRLNIVVESHTKKMNRTADRKMKAEEMCSVRKRTVHHTKRSVRDGADGALSLLN